MKRIIKYSVICAVAALLLYPFVMEHKSPILEPTPTEGKTCKGYTHQEWLDNCLSSWDGAHHALRERVKANLKRPESFKHVITSVGLQGDTVRLSMSYTADNSFGDQVTQTVYAIGTVCSCNLIKAGYEKSAIFEQTN